MAFTIPHFNLTCNIFTGPYTGYTYRLSASCNLQYAKHTPPFLTWPLGGVGWGVNQRSMHLLLPMGTDIRDLNTATGYDIVEVPAGTGRLYLVEQVDDVGKGFLNEHRCATLSKGLFTWPSPIP